MVISIDPYPGRNRGGKYNSRTIEKKSKTVGFMREIKWLLR
jgi:hypothetical protein